jgi:outer membrane lipoprotein-sorting protein
MNKLVLALVASVTLSAHAANPPELDKVLRQLDAASTKFQSTETDFKWDFYERVVKDTSTQTGSLYIVRRGTQLDMGAVVKQPGRKVISFHGNSLDIFDAATKQLQHFDATANRSQAESFLTLGFGGSGKDLESRWDITWQGYETVDNVQTAKLDLVAKDPGTRNNFSHVTIWVDPTRGISLKQIFETPSHDKRTNYYTNIRYDQKVNTKDYALPKK